MVAPNSGDLTAAVLHSISGVTRALPSERVALRLVAFISLCEGSPFRSGLPAGGLVGTANPMIAQLSPGTVGEIKAAAVTKYALDPFQDLVAKSTRTLNIILLVPYPVTAIVASPTGGWT